MGDGFTSTAASSFSELAATLGVSTERVANYTFNSSYTPEQLSSRVAILTVGNVVTNQLYEIIKERES